MIRLLLVLYLSGLTAICFGLWTHDWRSIMGGVLLGLAGPLIAIDADERKRRRVLDRLWDDDDLSESA